ncbi:universal stress protein [Blastococcus saxobsidens]|uniref:Nucleotide-binding universal stress UspA family protein n=1 Tax=Blastococcus saxobsidens TaxID=138336 RepID=A0A4Q7Y323_9ACTN|nr:universal stress protein [Blastococcus saxobsidens]RZU31230.1 nucleotide-binding universal stress UspA family protein [Blastococcus saxobsidens]
MLSDSERLTVLQIERDLLSDPEFARMVRPVADRVRGLAAPVVVGVSARSAPTGRAVEWAAAEAAAQGCPLHVVHTFRLPRGLGLSGMFPGTVDLHEIEVAGARALETAVARARSVHPHLEITAHLAPGSVAPALLRLGRDARLLVLGSRGDRRSWGGPGWLTGSLAARLSASARCPVAVVRPGVGAPCAVRPHVVVGVDGTPRCDAAVGFAFRAAQQRGLGVTAVHAWAPDRPADLEAVTAPLITTEVGAHDLLHRSLARWRREYPDVPVVPEVVRRDPTSALLDEARGAALVVVGTRGRGPARGAVFGSVSRAVVDGVPGAVAVVPAAATGAPTRRGVRT